MIVPNGSVAGPPLVPRSKHEDLGRAIGSLFKVVAGVPVWGWVLIAVGSCFLLFFAISFALYILTERRRARESGEPVRIGHVLWKATKTTFFLWIYTQVIPRWFRGAEQVFGCCGGRTPKRTGIEGGRGSRTDNTTENDDDGEISGGKSTGRISITAETPSTWKDKTPERTAHQTL